MNIHDRIEARCDNMTEDTPGIIPAADPSTLRVGRTAGKPFFRTAAGKVTNSYWVSRFPAQKEKMVYTLSQLLQSQQKAMKLVEFCVNLKRDGEYLAISVLGGEPRKIDPYEEDE